MEKESKVINEIDGVVENYRGCFNDFADSLKLIGDISMESGCIPNEHTYLLVAAMLKERETTLIKQFDEFAHALNYTARRLTGEEISTEPGENSARLRNEGYLVGFIQECCDVDENYVKQEETEIYGTFKEWWIDQISCQVPDKKSFSSLMSKRFNRVEGPPGYYFYEGIVLKEK